LRRKLEITHVCPTHSSLIDDSSTTNIIHRKGKERIRKEEVEKGTLRALLHTGYWHVYDTALLKVDCLQAADSMRRAALRNIQKRGTQIS
jgi:hypothetical protein